MNVRATLLVVLAQLAAVGCAAESSDSADVADDELRQEKPITVQNFAQHPRIVDVRNEAKATDDAIASGAFNTQKRENLCAGDELRQKHADRSGTVRKLVLVRSGPHGRETTTLYYNGNGKLRFAFQAEEGWIAKTNNKFETRVYVNDAGERIWEVERTATWQEGDDAPTMDSRPFTRPKPQDAFKPEAAWENNPSAAFGSAPECL